MCTAANVFAPHTLLEDELFGIDTPDVPSYHSQMLDALRSQIAIMPELLRAEQQYGPQFTDLNIQNQQRYLMGADGQGGMLGLYNQAMPQILALQSQGRAGDIADVATLGPQAYQATRTSNPQQAALMDALNQQALQQVQLGTQMTPDQQRMIRNGVIGQASAQGWGYNPGDLAEVARQASGYGDQLQQARVAQGAGVAGLNQSIYGDPFMQILGRQGQTFGALGGVGQQAVAGTQNLGPALFQPESQMAFDLWNTGYQGQLGANIAEANNKAGFNAGLASSFGSIFGGMACWVAREVYGVQNHQWLRFRHWLYVHAPAWFRKFYMEHGEAFAAWLHRRSLPAIIVRPWIRRWMDARIRSSSKLNVECSKLNVQKGAI